MYLNQNSDGWCPLNCFTKFVQPLHNVPYKHATRCLAAAAHLILRKKMFQTKALQVAVADEFTVHPKKMHIACLGRKYHPRKKPLKKKKKATTGKEKTEPEGKPSTSTEAMELVDTLEGTVIICYTGKITPCLIPLMWTWRSQNHSTLRIQQK